MAVAAAAAARVALEERDGHVSALRIEVKEQVATNRKHLATNSQLEGKVTTSLATEEALHEQLARAQVRKPPSWPRSWANFSLLLIYSCVPTGMHGLTCVFWTNLTPLSLQTMERRQAEEIVLMRKELHRRD